jgi:hypothetical protein
MGRGAKPTIWQFSAVQNIAIDAEIPGFEERVHKLNPDWQAHKKDLTKVKQDITGRLLDSEPFRALWDREHRDYMSEDESDDEGEKEREARERRKGGRKGWLEVCISSDILPFPLPNVFLYLGYYASPHKSCQQQNEAQGSQEVVFGYGITFCTPVPTCPFFV